MKMKIADRIMLALYAVLGVLALAILCACVLWPEVYVINLANMLIGMCSTENGKIVGCVLIAVLIAGLVHLIAVAFRKDVRGPKSSVSVQNTDSGAVRVSVQAMDSLVRRAIGEQEGVLGVKSKIVNHDDSITVHIDMALAMDSHIPNITMMMQRRIKRYIEETSGIAVREVIVLVSEMREGAAAIAAPVEAESPAEAEGAEEALPEEAASEEMIFEEPVGEETISEEAVSEEADSEETFPEEEADGEEAEYHEFSEDDELIAMEEAAEMEEAAVLEEVLAVEPDGEADDRDEANRAAGEAIKSTADDAE